MSKFNLLILFVFLLGCSKKDHQDSSSCVNYVGTHVVAGIRSTYTAEDVFKQMNTLNLKIERMSGFYYSSMYPIDSATLITLLSSKPYINAGGFSVRVMPNYQTKSIHITCTFRDMNRDHQKDWIETKKSLHLIEDRDVNKDVLLIVSLGKEQYWMQQLRRFTIVSWAELDCIGGIVPY